MADDKSNAGAAELTKVFVGNLSFKTTEDDLKKEFSAAGEVASVHIITRGPRSLGYGFVQMANDSGAHKAVELLNKKQIDGREINVEIAKPRDENAERPPRQRGRGRGRGSRGGSGISENGGQDRPRRGRGRGRRGSRGRGAPRAKSNQERQSSKTTVFVANLPFSVDDAALEKLFEGFKISKAHVVRKRNEKSKGFGFVEFDNEEEQARAVKEKDKLQCDGRELSVKVALTEPPQAEGGNDQ